jgi:hypothetical protein
MVDPVEELVLDLDDLPEPEPTSQVRSIGPSARRLIVDTGLRGPAAESAWVTVTDEAGAVYLEGSPSADGCVAVCFDGAPDVERVLVRLETATAHRQAQVTLGAVWTSHVFS